MIDVINLRKSFGDHDVLNGIDVSIEKGDIVVVIGPSGSGKSTFLRCLNCMEDPTGGQIIFNGVDIADTHVDINVHRRHMGMVFQHFNLFNNKTVLENIMMAPVLVRCQELKKQKKYKVGRTKKVVVAEAREKAMELLARIEVILRRVKRIERVYQYGDITVNVEEHICRLGGEEVYLTPKEFDVLIFFMQHKDVAISRDRLLAAVWGFEYEGESRTIDIHIQQLRKKLDLKDKLVTIPKLGYRLESAKE